MKHTISFVTSTYNEENNLAACLESVKDIVDEIIVVDGSSTDNTVKIAKEYGAKVVITTNPPIFLINRQKAIDLATKDWLLNLDADERLTPDLASEIKNELDKKNDEINGYYMPRKNWYLGRYLMKGGVYPDYQLRLYKRGKVHFALKDVHEQAIVEGETGYLHKAINHISDPVFKRYLLRFNRYTDRMADEFKDAHLGKNPLIFLQHVLIKPIYTFFMTYIRHKGFMDGWQGFVFHFYSSLRYSIAYIKYLRS